MYVDVVVALPLSALTFHVEGDYAKPIARGVSVVVRLGQNRFYQGIVWRVHDERPEFKTKAIEPTSSCDPLLTPHQMELWEWIASYYMCPLGEVMRAGLPASLKPAGSSQTEYSAQVFKPRRVTMVGLVGGEELPARAKKQREALAEISSKVLSENEIVRGELSADTPTLNALAKRGVITLRSVEREQAELSASDFGLPELTAAQRRAYEEITSSFQTHKVTLLQGVTGSGKTEIYMQMIAQQLAAGQDVLYLLPEIALTSQLISRLERCFGDRVVPYHSKYSDRQRAETYRRVALGRGELIVGVRSSIFLPFVRLGLVIVDEEHETSYKQSEPSPRYHARDCGIVLANLHRAPTLLGSATPSIESYANAKSGKYGYVVLTERYGGAVLPDIYISDTRLAAKRGERRSHFNKLLLDKMDTALGSGAQVMLFQNRRGYSPYVECGACGWIGQCPHCNVSLTMHRGDGQLRCHYCGYKIRIPLVCPSCNSPEPTTQGFGTEKIEQEIATVFPTAQVARLDTDTSRSNGALRKIISDFEAHRTNILVGTQMISKGFDFSGVTVVGVLNADNLINIPDFRATERAFQMMTQVSGRAGRGAMRGEVVIQTSQADNPLLQQVVEGDYGSMAHEELVVRQAFNYPPYCRIISLTLKHRDKGLLWRGAWEFEVSLRKVFGDRVLGPEAPSVDKIKRDHLVVFMLKIERDSSFAEAKKRLSKLITKLNAIKEYRYINVICDVDPQ